MLQTASGKADRSRTGGGATSQAQAALAQGPAQTCTGVGRGLAGNTALVGLAGGVPGQRVAPGTAAVIPAQFGLPSGAALAPFASGISGMVGIAQFSGVTDVIGGKSPIPGLNVGAALRAIYPEQLIVKIPGAADQGADAPVSISVPAGLGCPEGTGPALIGVPLPPGPGSPADVTATGIAARW